jgi:hypothetical protein
MPPNQHNGPEDQRSRRESKPGAPHWRELLDGDFHSGKIDPYHQNQPCERRDRDRIETRHLFGHALTH